MHDAVTVQDWWLARSPMTPYSCTDGKMCLSPRFLYPNTFDSLKSVMKLAPPPEHNASEIRKSERYFFIGWHPHSLTTSYNIFSYRFILNPSFRICRFPVPTFFRFPPFYLVRHPPTHKPTPVPPCEVGPEILARNQLPSCANSVMNLDLKVQEIMYPANMQDARLHTRGTSSDHTLYAHAGHPSRRPVKS